MFEIQATIDNATELQSAFQDHVLILAEAHKREADPSLLPVIAAHRAVQKARLAVIEAHLAGDRAAVANALESSAELAWDFLVAALDWRQAPLPLDLYSRYQDIREGKDSLITFLQDRASFWMEAIKSGNKPTLDDIREMEAERVERQLELATMEYNLAVDIVQHRMKTTASHLH